jgi:hypothetical protein
MGVSAAIAVGGALLVDQDQKAKSAKRQAKREAGRMEMASRKQEDALEESNKKSEMQQNMQKVRARQKALAAGAQGKKSTLLAESAPPVSGGYGGGSKTLLGS